MTRNAIRTRASSDHKGKAAEPQLTRRTRIRLKSVQDVCKYNSSCIRRTEREGGETTYYKRVMMAAMLVKALETGELEKRIERLESHLVDKDT